MSAARIAMVFCLLGSIAGAQEFRGSLSGRVRDAQGAVVPGVRVTATQVETGSVSETTSAGDGQFAIPLLPPGNYRISAEVNGFKRYVREGVRLSTGERLALDIELEVGQVSDSVTVSADAPLLETATASTGQVIRSGQIESMPMNGRTPLVMAQLAFGVIPSSDPKFYRPFDNAGPSTFSMGGAPARTNELLLDGAPGATGNSRVAFNPPVDAVEEVKVETFQADAAYGHTGGGTVNIVLKAGTNALHGTAYNFNQVSRLAATPFFTNSAGLKKPVTRYNQWGVNSGGPVMLPKVINGRNRLFFFFAYEGIKDAFPEPLTTTVPTEAQRQGDFSRLLAVSPSYQIFDPGTGVREGTRVRRLPFAGNIVPSNRLNAVAKNYLQFYPLPNQPGRPDGQDNYLANTVRRDDFNSELGRMDLAVNDRHKLFFSFRHNEATLSRGNLFNNIATSGPLNRVNWGGMVDDVLTISPTLVMNNRLSWTRFNEGNSRFSDGFDFTKLGFPAALAAQSTKLVLPRVNPDRFTGLGSNGGDQTPFDTFQIFSTLTKIAGKHMLKAGGDLRLYRESSIVYGNSSGLYNFSTDWTRGPLDNATAAPLGQDFAAFLLGLPTSGEFDINAARTNQAGYVALFVHDDFRVRSNLTVNIGLRYERDLPTTERYNRSVNGFDFTSPNPIGRAAIPAYNQRPIPEIPAGQFQTPGGLLFATAGNRSVYRTSSTYFSPRLGFALTPGGSGGKTVVRGGAGVFFFGLGTGGINSLGFDQKTPMTATLDGYLTPAATLTDPFPTGLLFPTGSSLGLQTFLGQPVRFFNPAAQNPYSVRWSFGVQRQLAGNLVLEAGYMGNHAVHLQVDRNLNFLPRQYLSTLPVRDQAVIDQLTANVANPFAGLLPRTSLNGATVQRQQLLAPYPQFQAASLLANRSDGAPSGGIVAQSLNDGSSYFHMLQVRLEKRFSHGIHLLTNYQWSKLMERRSRLNDSDLFLEKRIAGEDRPHRIVLSGSWELPFGRGKALAPGAGPIAGRIIGGWMVNGIYSRQPGEPLRWGNVIYYGGDLNLDARRVDGAFDTTRFNTNSRQQLDWNIRSFPTRFSRLRGDGVSSADLSVIKNTPLTERVNLQYRCEFLNAFNHPTFDPPNLSPASTNFGKVTNQPNLPRSIQMALRMVW